MDEQERLDLTKKSQEGIALNELKNHNGYKEFISILQNMYVSALEKLSRQDDADARAMIRALEDIVSTIDDKISLGEQAREELKTEAFKNQM